MTTGRRFNTGFCRARLRTLLLSPALLMSTLALAGNPSSNAPEPGVWQKHEYTFAFLGFTTTYSCDGLADKLKLLLTTAGARKDSKARPGACAAGLGRPDKFARAYLTFYTLAPTEPGKPNDGVLAAGVWRDVAFSDRKPLELDAGDCELVDQFRSQVLPMFTTRNLKNRTTCIPHQNSGSIDLKFESFAPPQRRTRDGK